MIVIICAKYEKHPPRTVDATERTQFSKSRPNDLEDIRQGQSSSHATHPLILLIICTKYRMNPSWTVDATGRTRKVNGQTDRRTDRQGESNIPSSPLPTSLRGGIIITKSRYLVEQIFTWVIQHTRPYSCIHSSIHSSIHYSSIHPFTHPFMITYSAPQHHMENYSLELIGSTWGWVSLTW